MYRSIKSLSTIIHQMWCNHTFRQRNKTTKSAVRLEVGGDGKGVDWTKLENGGRQYVGVLHKIKGTSIITNPLTTMSK